MSMLSFTSGSSTVLSAPAATRTGELKRGKDRPRAHRRGSLPLKKRRVICLDATTSDNGFVWSNEESPRHFMRLHRSSSLPPLIPTTSTHGSSFSLLNTNDFSFSKMNALSLIASAVVATEASMEASSPSPGLASLSYASEHSAEMVPDPPCDSSSERSRDKDVKHCSSSSFEENLEMEHYDSSNSLIIGTAYGARNSPLEEATALASLDQPIGRRNRVESIVQDARQSTPEPLNSPRPRKRNVSPATPMADSASTVAAPPPSTPSATSAAAKKTALTAPEASSANTSMAAGPDKRCTGHSDEIRCSATTTRGRACAYVAVGQTKYCYLHADYDTNPAPRRKSKDFGDDTEAALEDGSVEEELSEASTHPQRGKPKPKQRTLTPVAKTMEEKPPSPSPNGKVQFKKRFRRTSTKLAEKHADSPRPLLSMIATDQWFGKTVQIAMGPLEGRHGTVEKWGNGWVSVQVDGAGLHNRRSFELYIDDEGIKLTNGDVGSGSDYDTTTTSSPDNDKLAIPHVVSRDLVSPSPSTDSNKSRSGMVGQGPFKISKQSPLSLEKGLVSPRHSSKMSAAATVFPETPRAMMDQMSMDCSETPIPNKATVEAALKLPLPKVTPFSDRIISKSSCHSLSLTDSSSAFDLQLPDAPSSTKTKGSSDTKEIVFRPSMGERTRGRTVCSSEDDEDDTLSAPSAVSAALVQRTKKRDQLYLESSSCSFSG